MSQAGSLNTGGSGSNSVLQLTPDDLNPVLPTAGNINVFGLNGISTSNGGASTLYITGGVGLLQTASLTLTSAQVKTLFTNRYTIVPAQGVGTVILPYVYTIKTTVPTGDAFTNPGTVAVMSFDYYNGFTYSNPLGAPTDSSLVTPTTAYTLLQSLFQNNSQFDPTQIENAAFVVDGASGTGNYAGNAAGDNTVTINIQYVVQVL